MKTLPIKKIYAKKDRELSVLFGLVDLYIKTHKPIGSHSLQEHGFEYLSSATLRNYFNKLEKAGYLKQQHTSAGRIPTALAYREYANFYFNQPSIPENIKKIFSSSLKKEGKQISLFLQQAIETLSHACQAPVFLSSPKFDQDFLQEVKLILLPEKQLLSILITDFGTVKTEIINIPKPLLPEELLQIEDFFLYKLGKKDKTLIKSEPLKRLAQHFYNEIVLRHVIETSKISSEELFRTGLSKLLSFPEFNDPCALASSLALFEDPQTISSLLKECTKINRMTCWIGPEITLSDLPNCTILAIPYFIGNITAGAVAILCPMRIPYKHFFGILQLFSNLISETLTKNIVKYKIAVKNPKEEKSSSILLENKPKNTRKH